MSGDKPNLTDRLVSLWNHLDLTQANVAVQMPSEISGLARSAANRLGGIAFCTPTRLDPAPFLNLQDRLLVISGVGADNATVEQLVRARLPAASHITLNDYVARGWSDVVRDRSAEVLGALRAFFQTREIASIRLNQATGCHAEISYAIKGSGPPVALFPYFLAPSQWAPLIDELARDFTVISLGGRHLGAIALLEQRAQSSTFRTLLRTLAEAATIKPGDSVLDIGCGSGVIDRMLTGSICPGAFVIATDLNAYLLREAEALAEADGLSGVIEFRCANAEQLPFAEGTFDVALCVTVLEECNAARALSEMYRILRPGGRAAIAVRAMDMQQWWNLELPEAIREKVERPKQTPGSGGVGDATIYRRVLEAGFAPIACFPFFLALDPSALTVWQFREDQATSALASEERAVWDDAVRNASGRGLLSMAIPLHCAVARKQLLSGNVR